MQSASLLRILGLPDCDELAVLCHDPSTIFASPRTLIRHGGGNREAMFKSLDEEKPSKKNFRAPKPYLLRRWGHAMNYRAASLRRDNDRTPRSRGIGWIPYQMWENILWERTGHSIYLFVRRSHIGSRPPVRDFRACCSRTKRKFADRCLSARWWRFAIFDGS
jgi:hypothetical protein